MNKFFTVKLKWSEPKEGSDQMKKVSKRFLVRADSVTEGEARVMQWCPGNYQDPEVKGVDEAKLVALHKHGDDETWWNFVMSDENEKGKFVPFEVIINGKNEQEVLKEMTNKLYNTSQFEAMKRFKVVVDDDLIAEEIKPGLIRAEDWKPVGDSNKAEAKLFIQKGSQPEENEINDES